MKLRNTLLVLCLVFTAGRTAALSLGAVRGAVLLGQPLDVVLELQADADTTAETACVTAEAHFGDTPVESGRLQIQTLPAVAGRPLAVRIRTQAMVNEPVVTLRVSAGCAGSTTRTYSFLADLPKSLTAGSAPVVLPTFAAPPVAASPAQPRAAARRASGGSDGASGAVAATAPSPAPARTAPAKVPRKAAPVSPPVSAKPATPVRPRLVLEPLDDWLSAPASLRLSTDLLSVPADASDNAQRAQAAALWKSLNAEPSAPQTAVPDAAAVAELAAAKAQSVQAQAAVAELERRLSRLEEERFSATVVYALLGLLLAALAAAAWLWRLALGRSARAPQEPGWQHAVEQRAAEVAAEPESGHGRQRVLRTQSVVASARAATETVRSELSGNVPSMAASPTPTLAPRATAAAPAFMATLPEAPPLLSAAPVVARVDNPEDLFDLQQQAEFFISIGEHDQAIDVMQQYIAVNKLTSPLAYLELLRLYRLLSRAEDFASLRAQFHAHFNAQVPAFAAFNRASRSLLDYPDALADIEAVWSDGAVVALLERCLFCSESSTQAHGTTPRFELAAYDDLLLLYAIARTTPASARGLAPPRSRTTPQAVGDAAQWLQPESAREEPTRPADSNLLEFDLQPPLHHSLESRPSPLDIDLGELDQAPISALPPLTQSDLPARPVTLALAPGEVVGFGTNSDRFEARFDLEERKPGRR